MSKASLELGGGNWAAKVKEDGSGRLLGYAVGDTSGKYLPREFTFSRGADIAATRVNKDGLIEKYRENLLTYSNQFDTTWLTADCTVTGGQSGYDGSTDAWKLENTGSSLSYVRQSSLSVSGLQTLSFYAKAGNVDWLRANALFSGTNANNYFNIASGTIGASPSPSVITSSITEVATGWYRISLTYNDTVSEIRIHIADGDGDEYPPLGSYIYIQDAQLERGLVATDYLESGSTTGKAGVLDNLPRIDYTGGSASLLLEPERKNEVPNSEGVVETDKEVTLTVNHGIAPDGTKSSLKVAKNGFDDNDRIQPISDDNVTLTNSADYSISAFVKNIDCTGVTTLACRTDAGSNELFRQGFQWTGASLALTSAKGSGTRTGAFVESYGNDWWRIGFTFTANSTAGDFELDIDRENGSATTSIETWGWQLEKGSYPTSYIPTYGVSATRNVDVADGITINTNANHTMLYDLETTSGRESTSSLVSVGYDVSNRYFIKGTSSSNVQFQVSGIGVFSGNINPTNEVSGRNKIAVQWIDGTGYVYCNGVKQIDTLSNSSSSNDIDYYELSGSGYSHKTHQFLIFPTALTDSECIALTTL